MEFFMNTISIIKYAIYIPYVEREYLSNI